MEENEELTNGYDYLGNEIIEQGESDTPNFIEGSILLDDEKPTSFINIATAAPAPTETKEEAKEEK